MADASTAASSSSASSDSPHGKGDRAGCGSSPGSSSSNGVAKRSNGSSCLLRGSDATLRSPEGTFEMAQPYRVGPLGEQSASFPGDGMLTDEQVVTCASVLLYATFGESSSSLNAWVTDLLHLRVLMASGCPEDLQSWLRRRNVTVYVVACTGHCGFVDEGGGHWICFAISSNSPQDCNVMVYDSNGPDSLHYSWGFIRAEVVEASKWISNVKFETEPTPRVRLAPIAREDFQRGGADCGFHVALFIAGEAAAAAAIASQEESSAGDRSDQDREEALPSKVCRQLAQLHNCPVSARVLREWLRLHGKGVGGSSSWGEDAVDAEDEDGFQGFGSTGRTKTAASGALDDLCHMVAAAKAERACIEASERGSGSSWSSRWRAERSEADGASSDQDWSAGPWHCLRRCLRRCTPFCEDSSQSGRTIRDVRDRDRDEARAPLSRTMHRI